MHDLRVKTTLALALLLASTQVACTSPSTPLSLVDHLKVLAVQANPPEINLGQPAAYTLLVGSPQGVDFDLAIAMCTPSPDGCLEAWLLEDRYAELATSTQRVSMEGLSAEIPSGPLFAVSLAVLSEEMPGGFPADMPDDASEGTGDETPVETNEPPTEGDGLPSEFESALNQSQAYLALCPDLDCPTTDLEVIAEAGMVRPTALEATKSTVISGLDNPQPANLNPLIEAGLLQMEGQEAPAEMGAATAIAYTEVGAIEITIHLDPASIQTYTVVDESGESVEQEEQPYVRFYATLGQFDRERIAFEVSETEEDWVAVGQFYPGGGMAGRGPGAQAGPSNMPSGEHHIWAVVHDGRGGVSWISQGIRFE